MPSCAAPLGTVYNNNKNGLRCSCRGGGLLHKAHPVQWCKAAEPIRTSTVTVLLDRVERIQLLSAVGQPWRAVIVRWWRRSW